MTTQEAETAIRAAGVGWDSSSEAVVLTADETPGYCNVTVCSAYAAAASKAGVTPAELGTAIRELVDGDDTSLRVILAA